MAIFILLVAAMQTGFFILYLDYRKKPIDTRPAPIRKLEKDNPNIAPHDLHFMQGEKRAWELFRLSVFQLYIDGDILDFVTMYYGIITKIKTLDNKENFTSIVNKYNEFVLQVNSSHEQPIEPMEF